MERFVYSTEFAVRLAEVDEQKVVKTNVYVVWLEEARIQYVDAKGIDYARFIAEGYALPVIDLTAHIHRAARFGDLIIAYCWIEQLDDQEIIFGYELTAAGQDTRLVTAQTRHRCWDRFAQWIFLPESWRHGLNGHGAT